jgi:hypothetical protein
MTSSSAGLTIITFAAGLLLVACSSDAPNPTAVTLVPSASLRADDRDDVDDDTDDVDDDVENPILGGAHAIVARANLNVTLRGDGHGHKRAHGHIRFRQPQDAAFIVLLDTRVRGLTPNTDYRLQRAVDAIVDDNCTSEAWLTLGQLGNPLVINTDKRGRGHAQFSRDLSSAAGAQFDIHFRVINAATSAVVLQSTCYQFVVSQ